MTLEIVTRMLQLVMLGACIVFVGAVLLLGIFRDMTETQDK